MNIVVVDNHDSFTFNLVEYVRLETGRAPAVVTNDVPWESSGIAKADAVIISPGPGHPGNPDDLGLSAEVIERFGGPILGVCLGMQAFVQIDGGKVTRLPRPAHGVTGQVSHDGTGLFSGLANPLTVVRYHSLHAADIPASYRVTARLEDGVVMGIEHRSLPRFGVQFHPESMAGHGGRQIIRNFLALSGRFYAQSYFSVRTLDYALDPAAVAAGLAGKAKFWLQSAGMHVLGAADEIHTCVNGGFFDTFRDTYAASLAPARVAAPIPGLDFSLGWVGYLGYEAGAPGHSPYPDAEFAFARRAVIVDPQAGKTHLLAFAGDDGWTPQLATPPKPAGAGPAAPVHDHGHYLSAIARAQEYLAAGDTYEVCLTNRYELEPVRDSLAVYLAMEGTGYLSFPAQELLSATPELFLAVDGYGQVTSRPIKGTRPRDPDRDASRDESLIRQLSGEKETAELLMVADMVRHDLSRVCTGVTHNADFYVRTYPTVHQLMVDITGQLTPGKNALDAVEAAFPGGSMTGAPKERTMGIIQELEGTWRGAYSGAFGFLSTTGQVELSMTIRTLVNTPAGAYYGVGGAVLSLSDPEAEWEETQVKLRPLRGIQWN
ncbi:hypothetical protein CPHO_08105 [Corynebacterium phocae]|uniref:aminodeoxychorismate synthase n=1 Tax=Corynebacterium phocae TaxID=161895 RepID=A0A1L7D3Z9_9CORY|nr:chorismate-binding protein [Corynebacterium phocae]APT92854.1 hypothetical protein CPHO_08105 [Corynebacterium phocae]KAA8723174.1 aminodeoxychorismate synthase component I [Corynebacterium phocae]